MNSLSLLAEYDWREAFSYAKGFGTDDVSEIIDYKQGENDGLNWIMYGRLKDGRYFALSAGCDYTGWDCQAGGDSEIKATLPELLRFGMGDDERDRYGIVLDVPRSDLSAEVKP